MTSNSDNFACPIIVQYFLPPVPTVRKNAENRPHGLPAQRVHNTNPVLSFPSSSTKVTTSPRSEQQCFSFVTGTFTKQNHRYPFATESNYKKCIPQGVYVFAVHTAESDF